MLTQLDGLGRPQAAAASASKSSKPIVIPPPPAPVIIEAPPPKKVETVDASTQASQPVAVVSAPPPKVEEDDGSPPVRDVRQTHEYREAMAMQESRRKAHQENMVMRKLAGRMSRNKGAFFREWRRKVEDNKRLVESLFVSEHHGGATKTGNALKCSECPRCLIGTA